MTIRPALRAWIAHVGSLRTTLAGLALLAAAVGAGLVAAPLQAAAIGSALALLAGNLAAALVVHPLLRRQLALLVAHLALLALVLLAALGRLTSLDGRFELAQGQTFDGTLLDARAGPWHGGALARLAFRNEGFEIDYAAGRKRGATRNLVRWTGDDGREREAVIGDHRPLLLHGHRIYTSPNKGFAPILSWRPHDGAPITGAVHLPSYPSNELRQSIEWRLPDGREAWVQLRFDEALIDPAAAARFRLPDAHSLVLRVGDQRAELAPGQSADLGSGTLTYVGLRSWMGYRIAHDPTLPWLLAAALLAAGALAVHYAQRFVREPLPGPASEPEAHAAATGTAVPPAGRPGVTPPRDTAPGREPQGRGARQAAWSGGGDG